MAALQNSLKMQGIFLTLTAIAISTVNSDNNNFMTNRQDKQVALCIQTIAHKYFTAGRTVLVSMPSDEQYTVRSLSLQHRQNHLKLVSSTLKHLHQQVSWPLRLLPPEITIPAGVETTHSYIIFTWPQQEDIDIMDTLRTQVENLKEAEGASWNPRGKFLVVANEDDGVPPRDMALQIYTELWHEHFIIDNTVLIAGRDTYLPMNDNNYTDGLQRETLDLCTGFPHERGKCGDVTDVTLLDQWHLLNGTFMHNHNLFPPKIPDNFHGCKIRVASFGVPPYVMLTGNSTDENGNVVYKLGGLAMQNILLAAGKMNLTVVFLKPSISINIEYTIYETVNLVERKSDIIIGTIPLLPVLVTPWFQPTIPYDHSAAKWFYPCPKSVSRMEKVMQTYKISVWLTMATVFFITSTVWWYSVNWRYGSLKQAWTFQAMSLAFYNAYAVCLGVSVHNVPNTWNFRFLFLLYVCYSFAISTVFQAFFISYLVEPGYGKKFETFDELLHSSLSYGYNDALETGMASTSYDEHLRFHSSRRQDCNDMRKCMERIANNAQLCTISDQRVSLYLATEMGIHDASEYLCTLEENLLTTGFTSLLSTGSPFMNRINILTRRSVEGGLLSRYFEEVMWLANLRSKVRAVGDQNNSYFVFSFSHLSPAFCVLSFGYMFSLAVFIAEIFVKWFAKLQHYELD